MKKLLFLGGLIAFMLWSAPALAATNFSLSPSSIVVTNGQAFTVNLTVNPNQTDNYTVKFELVYPADLLEVKSFNFSNGWTALAQSGYDLIDNQAGYLIKTAGYLGGFSNPLSFGAVSFLSKKSGNGLIKITNNSLALDKNSQNLFDGSLIQTSVTINPLAPTPSPPPPPLSEKAAVLGVAIPGEEPDQKEQTAPSEEEPPVLASDQSASQELRQEPSKPIPACQKTLDWTILFIGFIDGALFAVIVFNALQRRKQRK